MRRPGKPGVEVPDELLHFRPFEWADDEPTATRLWQEARREWLHANRDAIDGGWFIAQGYDERRRVLFGIEPPPRWPRLR